MKKLIQATALLMIAGTMMGNQSCQSQAPESRELRRRVQMGRVTAPPIALPDGGTFDFQNAVNLQMYEVLKKTKSFSTATIDPSKVYDPSGLSDEEAKVFNQCGDEEDQASFAVAGKIMSKTTISKKAACMINQPQGIVGGGIIDFTLVSDTGLKLSLAQLKFAPSLNFKIKRYELALAMQVRDPLVAGGNLPGDTMTIASTSKQSFGKEWSVGLGFDIGMLGLGLNHYAKTPLRQVVDEGLTAAISDLKTEWTKAQPWYAMVLRNCDKYIYINAGSASDAGLMKGDIVRIQNVAYNWDGDVCKSRLNGAVDYIGGPVGYARIINVGNTMSTAQIIERDENYPRDPNQIIYPGARVYLEKFFVSQPAQAKK